MIIRPENIVLHEKSDKNLRKEGNIISARIAKVSFTGNVVNYFAQVPGFEDMLRCQSTPPLRFTDNMEVVLRFLPESCVLVET
jgi:hypothetical protein